MLRQGLGWLDNPLTRALASPRSVDDYLGFFNPLWSTAETRARLVEKQFHNRDVVSLRLKVGSNWRMQLPGQHLLLGVEIDGVRQQRCFSVSSVPDSELLEVTVKRNARGLVSNYIVDQLTVGDLLWVGQAEGEFVLPEPRPERLLFVSAGSGITPLMAMVRQLAKERYNGELLFLNFARSEQSLIFKAELEQLQSELKGLRLVHKLTAAGAGHCDAALLREHLDQPPAYSAFVCGPEAMMQASSAALAGLGVTEIYQEHFTANFAATGAGDGLVQFQASQVTAAGDSAGSLLQVAEQAGLTPAYGCRMGICHACTCKVSGSIRDLRNGELKQVDNADLQICVHAAAGSVQVDI